MDAFWKWLMKANARGVFASALVALVLVSAFWIWRILMPVAEPSVGGSPRPARGKLAQGLGVREFLQAQTAPPQWRAPSGLFGVRASAKERTEEPDWVREFFGSQTPDEAPAEASPAEPSQPRDIVSLTYRGVFVGTDGRALALIEDSKSKRGAFYERGDPLFGVTVGEVGMNEATVVLSDGSEVRMAIGAAERFEDGQRAD